MFVWFGAVARPYAFLLCWPLWQCLSLGAAWKTLIIRMCSQASSGDFVKADTRDSGNSVRSCKRKTYEHLALHGLRTRAGSLPFALLLSLAATSRSERSRRLQVAIVLCESARGRALWCAGHVLVEVLQPCQGLQGLKSKYRRGASGACYRTTDFRIGILLGNTLRVSEQSVSLQLPSLALRPPLL